ncbi:hypothetical protein M2232_004414 [Bradyrhizobium japonicum]|nr:hypothetical protein [Bradyrhizobium japonicum]MCS3960237.1 hypothetical protein [Bradyrhizobium japonicum]MCS3978671.1 hypothetical protein [Bradyrhizobium japonicum]MCS4001990.1 hypothetical protein [Bradyrhizobium japonicum]MCW2220882.1 hypothetical protein [Bradyrhizobium japonicum]
MPATGMVGTTDSVRNLAKDTKFNEPAPGSFAAA